MIRRVFVDGKPYLLDADGTMLPPVMGGQWGDYKDPGYGAGTAPTAAGSDVPPGVKLPLSIQPIGGGVGILVDADGIPVVGDDGMPILRNMETGGAGSAPAYSGTQPAQAAQHAHDQNMARLQAQLAEAASVGDYKRQRELQIEILGLQQDFEETQSQLNRDFQAKQNRLAEEAALKQSRLGVLQNLVEGFMQSQQRASEFVLSQGPSAFRFAAAAQGMPVFGTTPEEGYAQALTEYTQRPAPSMDPNAPLSAIEGGIESIMGQRFPLDPGLFGGMSGGGTVPMGASGTFLVGEKGPEVMDVSPSGVTVKPLSGGFADGGGVDFDVSSIYAGLAPLFASLGFAGIPQFARSPAGGRGFTDMGGYSGRGAELLQAMGLRPNLVTMGGKRFYVEDDVLRQIRSPADFERFGFRSSDMLSIHPRTATAMGWSEGAPLTQAPQFTPRPAGPMSTMPFLATEPTTGVPLPAPFKAAYELRRLRAENPDLYNIATSAYDYPNSPVMPGAFQTAMDIFTPRGTQRRLTGLR